MYSKTDSTLYKEEPLKHLVYGGESQNLKKFCTMGSDRKVGMSWVQFKDEGHGAVEAIGIVSKHLVGTYYTIQEDFRNRVTYYIFHKVSDAEKLIKNFICR
ncbi:hypothetical protein AYI69_g8735 [Smittium culicis]|uniref:Uncharacterized protein n=1 Tax=Smittium culicis TaxID=133412 RepID=A0A1R1XHM0_9FUNG|nr:hypothetical protein AYI69_g8735 [Smittium culicis]